MSLSIVTKEMFGQNEMNIYQDEHQDIYMTREQIGEALGYKNPKRAIKDIHIRNRDRLDQFSEGAQIDTPLSGEQQTTIYNEKGIYEIIRHSKQPKADAFYDWVYDLLSRIRKGDMQIEKPNNTKVLLQTALKHEEEIEGIRSDVTYLKETMRIDGREEQIIRKRANQVVVEALGGKSSIAYKEMAFKAFSAFWRDFKDHFEIPRYGDLPKNQFEDGLRFIGIWTPSTSLRIEIEQANKQQAIEGVI